MTNDISFTKKKILLVSSGQPSLNPRLVKEADSLADAGYNVTVLYAYWNDWGTKFDTDLIASKQWKAICAGGSPGQKKFIYFLSRVIHNIARLINKKTKGKYFAELALTRAAYFLTNEAKKCEADLYIAHNLGALPAAVNAAKTNKKPCGFDAEDFHRFEISDDKNDADVLLKTWLENRYIPQINYLTASSPLIAKAYNDLFVDKEPIVILNVFPRDSNIAQPTINNNGPVRLFWFSQTIGEGRGIENIINALLLLEEHSFELHMLGEPAENAMLFFDKLIINKPEIIHFHKPIPPDEIVAFASQFDIGLASETKTPLNRDICLTNKIFTYLQAGLAILASDTTAQTEFVEQYPAIGKIYRGTDVLSLANTLTYYSQNRNRLFETREASLKLAQDRLNWETESRKFLSIIKNI